MKRITWLACALVLAFSAAGAACVAQAKSVRGEYYEGKAEIRREREEMRRDILNAESRWEARRAYQEGMREIRREKREMRREMRQAFRGW